MRTIMQIFSLSILLLLFTSLGWFFLERTHILQTSFMTNLIISLLPDKNTTETITGIENDSLLLDKLRLEKKQEELTKQEFEIDRKQKLLELQTQELVKEVTAIQNERLELEEEKKTINEFSNINENKRQRVREVAFSLMNMPPKSAVEILVVFNDEMMIDTLQAVNQLSEERGQDSVVPFWLSLMDPTRAGEIQKKIINR